MEIKTISHPLRKISITYGYNDNPWTKEDEQLVKAFIALHESEMKQQKLADYLLKEYSEIRKKIKVARTKLEEVTILLKDNIKEADKLSEKTGLIKPKTFPAFLERIMNTNDEIQEYGPLLSDVKDALDLLQPEKELYAVTDEDTETELWDKYSDIHLKHCRNYEKNSIDIVEFDKEDDSFRTYRSVHEDNRNGKIDYSNDTIEDYNVLVIETEMQYQLWAEFNKRRLLLEYIFGEDKVFSTVLPN